MSDAPGLVKLLLDENLSPWAAVNEDYPYLTNEDVELARLFAKAYPHVGRPRARQAATR